MIHPDYKNRQSNSTILMMKLSSGDKVRARTVFLRLTTTYRRLHQGLQRNRRLNHLEEKDRL